MQHPRRIHLWTPGLFDFKGGIQVYSQFLLQGLQSLSPADCDVFLMHDRSSGSISDEQLAANRTQFHYLGHIPKRFRTAAFAAQIFSAGILQQPDLIITTHLNFTPIAECLKRLFGIPYWTIAHGFEAWNIQRPALKRALRNADRILAVSNYTRDRLLQAVPLEPNQIQLLPNTFDSNRFQVADKPIHLLKKHNLQFNQPVILTVNRLAAGEAFHSYDQILAALPRIRSQIPDVHYLIVGKGDDRPRLRRLIVERQLQDCVTLVGFVPDEDLPDYYNLCDVFAMPSKLEGFGIVYLEALASGKPVLGGNDGAVDALQQGKLGALVNPDDIKAIAGALIQLLDKTYPNSLIYQPETLRQTVMNRFGFEAFCHTLNDLLEASSTHSATCHYRIQ